MIAALHTTYHILRTTYHVLSSTYHTLRTTFYVLRSSPAIFSLAWLEKILSMLLEPILGYTRFVSIAKMALIFIAVVLAIALVAFPILKPVHEQFNLTFSEVKTKDLEKPKMVSPKLYGTDDDGQPYNVVADEAVQHTEHQIKLKNINADITLSDESWLALISEHGLVESKAHTLDLMGGVNMFTDGGFELYTDVMHVNFQDNTAHSDAPVEGHSPMGTLSASGFKVSDKGETIYFTGRVKVIIYPQDGQGKGKP